MYVYIYIYICIHITFLESLTCRKLYQSKRSAEACQNMTNPMILVQNIQKQPLHPRLWVNNFVGYSNPVWVISC